MARTDGQNPSLIKTDLGWDLFVNGVKVLSIDSSGNLSIKGDMKANESI